MFFRPKNSIIVSFDYQGPHSFLDFEEQLNAIEKHYRFCKLTDWLPQKKPGRAFVIFENPRKGVLIHGVRLLLSRQIPFTMFIDTDYVGLNRLPLEEEVDAYQKAYPDKLKHSEVETWLELAAKDPKSLDDILKKARQDLGPLPIENLDSLLFFSTWGKLVECPQELVDFGLSIRHTLDRDSLNQKIQFAQWQLKQRLRIGRLVKKNLAPEESNLLKESGIEALIGHETGEIIQRSSHWNLPIWSLEENPD